MKDDLYTEKKCEICGKPIPVHISKKGYKESRKQYSKRKYCSNECRHKGLSYKKLTEKNYYTTYMDMKYVSASQYKLFFNPYKDCCEAAALAQIKGEIERPETESLLIGSYVDEALTGNLKKFCAEHPELFSTRGETKGELKSTYKQAEKMLSRARADALFMSYVVGGKHQVIMTGEIGKYRASDREFVCKSDALKYIAENGLKEEIITVQKGVPIKIKIDHVAYKNGNPVAIVDLKTVKSMYETFWVKDSGEHLTWPERWMYDMQLGLYQEVYKQNTGLTLPCYLAAISKDKTENIPHPRLKIIQIPQTKMDERMVEFKRNIGKIQDLKQGKITPISCGKCDYCADTLPCEVISMDELLLEV